MSYSETVNVQTTTDTSNDTPTEWFRMELLDRSERYDDFTRYGTQVKLPGGQGDTVQFVRYNRPGAPSETLTEGVTPDGQDISVSKVNASVDQWGGYFTLSDTAILQTVHGPFEQTAELAGQQWGIVRSRECQRVLRRATSVFYANSRASRTALTATDYMTTADAIRMLETLRAKGAPTYEGGLYKVIMPTAVEADMMNDSTWVQTKMQQDQGPLERGEFLRWMGASFVRSNQIPSYVLNTSANGTSTAASASGDTALGDATYYTAYVAVDKYGQEYATSAEQSDATSSQILTMATPALLSSTDKGYNLYAGTATGVMRLQKRQASASTTYRLSLDGTGTNGVAYSTSGVLIEPIPTASVTVHPVFYIGKGWYACTENGSVVTTMTQPTNAGRTTDSDPLGQRRKVGWKGWFKDCILNEEFGLVLWCASRYTGYRTV
jgi:N4-gp56 family major capsid protein